MLPEVMVKLMLKTNVLKRPFRITRRAPGGGISVVTVQAESKTAALTKAVPQGWVSVKVEELP